MFVYICFDCLFTGGQVLFCRLCAEFCCGCAGFGVGIRRDFEGLLVQDTCFALFWVECASLFASYLWWVFFGFGVVVVVWVFDVDLVIDATQCGLVYFVLLQGILCILFCLWCLAFALVGFGVN